MLWYHPTLHPLLWPLWPLSKVFSFVAATRRKAIQPVKVGVPVVVVGNISVGGTGKTPVVLWLAQALQARGVKVGVVSRGYGGKAPHYPFTVETDTSAAFCGDEPLLIRQHGIPVVVAPDRVAAAKRLVQQGTQIIVADDGLQHYRLHRDLEIAVVDAARGVGNGHTLPAGPLREPPARLSEVDFVLKNGENYRLQPQPLQALSGKPNTPQGRIHAIAGIGRPRRFFDTLRALGLEVIEHPMPDHHAFVLEDFAFDDALPIVMTDKDAVKALPLLKAQPALLSRCWRLPVVAQIDDAAAIMQAISRLLIGHEP
jgi:tetraacyldisaccharide 4'-kinase